VQDKDIVFILYLNNVFSFLFAFVFSDSIEKVNYKKDNTKY